MLRILLSDIRDKVVPSIFEYILKDYDVNKGVEIDGMAPLTLLADIQISLAEKA